MTLKNTLSKGYVSNERNVGLYLNDIRDHEILSCEQELELVMKAKNGDIAARNELIEKNQSFIFAVAKRYAADKVLDLVNEAATSFDTAIDKYDPTMGFRFLTFAINYMRREMIGFLNTKTKLVRKTNDTKTAYHVENIKNKFYCINGRYPSDDEILDILYEEKGIKVKKNDLADLDICSIDANVVSNDGNEATFEDSSYFNNATCSSNLYEIDMDKEHEKSIVEKYLSVLKERDREIVKMAYGIGYKDEMSIGTISEELNLSQERIRQIISSSIMKMQKAVRVINK